MASSLPFSKREKKTNQSINKSMLPKRRLQDERVQRQNHIKHILEQCEQLRLKHKEVFENRFRTQVLIVDSTPYEQKKVVQKTEIDAIPIGREVSEFFSESLSSSIFANHQQWKKDLVLPKMKHGQRCASVSTVAQAEKQSNRVCDKWPSDDELCQIVGYRIQKKPVVIQTIDVAPKKQRKSLKFAAAVKQVKKLSINEAEPFKSPVPVPSVITPRLKLIEPILPTAMCPASKLYSKRIQTRQWLVKNSFYNRSVPLI